MGIEPTVSVHARVQKQANIIPMREDAIHECPAGRAEFLFSLWIPEEVLSICDRYIGVHPAAVNADDRFGQKRGRQTHVRSNLATDQLVELDLVGRSHDFAITIVDFKL